MLIMGCMVVGWVEVVVAVFWASLCFCRSGRDFVCPAVGKVGMFAQLRVIVWIVGC